VALARFPRSLSPKILMSQHEVENEKTGKKTKKVQKQW